MSCRVLKSDRIDGNYVMSFHRSESFRQDERRSNTLSVALIRKKYVNSAHLPKSLISHDFHRCRVVLLNYSTMFDQHKHTHHLHSIPLKSTPIVAIISESNRSSVKRRRRELFPTPDSPIIKILNVAKIDSSRIGIVKISKNFQSKSIWRRSMTKRKSMGNHLQQSNRSLDTFNGKFRSIDRKNKRRWRWRSTTGQNQTITHAQRKSMKYRFSSSKVKNESIARNFFIDYVYSNQ